MPRSPFPGGLFDASSWRRGRPRGGASWTALGAIVAVLLATGIILGTGLPGSSKGASRPTKASAAATVERRDLVATDTESGTLSYADRQTVFNRVSGTITWLPVVGAVIRPGQTLYKVDGTPVVLFDGAVPAYRDLSSAVSDGPDVQELKQNLVALGFDPSHQITVNQTFDAATAAAVDGWQAAVGETQTGTVTLGHVVFLPGPQRITAVNTVLGSTGGGASASGASGSGSSSGSSGSSSGTSTGASTSPAPPRPQFVSLTTTTTVPSTMTLRCPPAGGQASSSPGNDTVSSPARNCDHSADLKTKPAPATTPGGKAKSGKSQPSTLAALIALLKAETLELQKSRSSGGAGGTTAAGTTSAAGSGRGSGGGGGASASGATSASGAAGASGASGATSSGGSGSASGATTTAQQILQTTSTQLVVTVNLDATKQAEAVVGEPVTVQLPDGSTADGKITQVSPVAQSSSSSSSGGAGAAASSTPSATVPVTITLTGRRPVNGLDQAAVSVNFQQQKASNAMSVPVTALLATAGGGYAVQEAAAPHRLIPVTPGLFAAGYVQISGSQIYPGLQITDSQG